jgi:hypothetical protein
MDSIQNYCNTLIEEQFDNMNEDERKEFIEMLKHERVRPLLREYVEEILNDIVDNIVLIDAILKSCDWNDIYEEIQYYIEENYVRTE